MKRNLFVWLGLLLLASCGENTDPRKQLEEVKKKAFDVIQGQVTEKIKAVIPAIENRDLDKLKGVCSDLDKLLSAQAMGYYYDAFAIEAKSGPAASPAFLAEKLADPSVTENDKSAIKALNEYFTVKGTLSTKDAGLIVVGVVLDMKFPHTGASKLVRPFMDSPPPPKP